ncbi:hypothetical protein IAR55_007187 [Kwoniella newhampshirensis]|uniref:Uncharacterized protein n=1 Tax=Kwoniella newhampshirensis TaxID=1651941 RepID=A0AAW0YD90_9TREE
MSNGETLINTTSLFQQQDPSLDKRFFRKAFPRTAYDVKMIPYYRRRTRNFAPERITLITWITVDRFPRLASLAKRDIGPISVVVYTPADDRKAATELHQLDQLLLAQPLVAALADIHLVTGTQMIMHNMWRNIARAFATTDWVMLWDADFEPCTDYQAGFERFRAVTGEKEWVNRLDRGKAALVMPVFEWVKSMGTNGLCPRDKEELAEQYRLLSIDAFESDNPKLSHATNYAHFVQSDKPYEVVDFEFLYEVYAIFRQDMDVWGDERFVGLGFERAAFTASMWLSDMELYVLPDQWAVHEPHPAAAIARKTSVDNLLAWNTFRTDLCHSTANSLSILGQLHLDAGRRVLMACQNLDLAGLKPDLKRLLMMSNVNHYRIENSQV